MGPDRLATVALLAPALLGVAGTGCGGAPAEPRPPHVRLALTPVAGHPWSADAVVVSRAEPASSPGRWSVLTESPEPNSTLAAMEAEGQAVILSGMGARSQTVAILSEPLDPSAFNQVRIHHVLDGETSVKIVLRGRDLEDWTSISVPVRGDTEARSTVIPVPRYVREAGPRNKLRVVYAGGQRTVGLVAVEFLDQHAAGLLPDPRLGRRLIRIGGQWRDGFGLTPDHPLEATFEHVPGAALVFSTGELLETRTAGRKVSLVVTLSGAGQEIARELPIDGVEWRLHTLAPELPPGPVTARFEVNAEGDGYAACAVAEPALYGAPPERPSVLLVTSDTHRGDHLGVAGEDDFVSTPNLDRLAAGGVYFDQCFVLSNVTNPSHVTLFTGLDPAETRISSNKQVLGDAALTLAEVFRSRGYTTWAALSVRHLVGDVSGLGQGFDRMVGPTEVERTATETVDQALSWLTEEQRAPLFLWVHLYDAHWPYEPPAEFEALYAHEIRARRRRQSWNYKIQETRGHIENLGVPRAAYKGEVTYLDQELGRLLDHEHFDAGVVALVGDHGEALGEHKIFFTHAELYPDVLHVPLLLRWPEAPAGTRVAGLASQLDLGRTLLDLVGLQDAEFPGRGLLRHVAAGAAEEELHLALSGGNTCASVTRGGMHLMLHLLPHRSPYSVIRKEPHAVELYDLREDPRCLNDLVDKQPQLAAELRAIAIRWLRAADPDGLLAGGVDDPELERQLNELGYFEAGGAAAEPLWSADACDWCTRFDS